MRIQIKTPVLFHNLMIKKNTKKKPITLCCYSSRLLKFQASDTKPGKKSNCLDVSETIKAQTWPKLEAAGTSC